MSGLFYEESKINLQRIKLNNISTNGKGLINSFYNDLIISGLDANNITCYGDSGDSSLILFDSNIVSKRLELDNININDSSFNGPTFKILGSSNEILINNLYVNNVKSFGPIIDNMSKIVIIDININILIKYYYLYE